MTAKASCQFCSKTDDSIQVVCESRCLLCSKCQLVPAIRKLLIDHTLFSDDPSIHQQQHQHQQQQQTLQQQQQQQQQQPPQLLPVQQQQNLTDKPSTEMKSLEEIPIKPLAASNSSSTNIVIATAATTTIISNAVSSNVAIALKGSCPICSVPMSMSMLLMIQSYREGLKSQLEDQIMGVHLEETSHMIHNFFKRFRVTYENPNEGKLQLATATNNAVDLDAEIETFLNNPKAAYQITATANGVPSTLNPANKASKIAPPEKETIPAAAKVNITNVLEFIVECYHAQWQSIVKNSNDSMLTTMMKQSSRKKFSQKTNDYKTKGLIDFLLSNYGYEMPELILFCHLIGLQPKYTTRLSPAWSNLSATVLVAICFYDQCVKSNELYNDQTTSNAGMNEFKGKLFKCFHMISLTNNNANNPAVNQLNANNTKVISVKKSLKIIQFLQTIRHPYWIMAPLMATCVEYECRLAWTEDSIAKIIAAIFFVALMENNLLKKGVTLFTTGEPSNNANNVGTNTTTFLTADSNNANPMGSSLHSASHKLSSLSAAPTTPATRISKPTGGRRSSSSLLSNKSNTTSVSNDSEHNIPMNNYKPVTSRPELLRRLHSIIDVLWKDCNERFSSLQDVAASRRNSFLQLFQPNQQQQQPPRRGSKANQREFGSTQKPWKVLLDYWGELDEHVLHRKERSFFPLTINEAIEMTDTANLMLPINDLLYIIVLCWEREYNLLQFYLEKAKLTKLRRPAITANYANLVSQNNNTNNSTADTNNQSNQNISALPRMTAGEKQAIIKLLYFYRNQETKEFPGVDWDEVEDQSHSSFYPFTIPRSLLLKSRIELNLLSEHLVRMILEQIIKDENEFIQLQNETNRVLLNYTTHAKAKENLLTTNQMIAREMEGDLEDMEDEGPAAAFPSIAEEGSVSTFNTVATPPIIKIMDSIKTDALQQQYSEKLLSSQMSLEEVNRKYIPNYDKGFIQHAIQSQHQRQRRMMGNQSSPSFIPSHLQVQSHLPIGAKHLEYGEGKDLFTVGGLQKGILSPNKNYHSSNSLPVINHSMINRATNNSKDQLSFVDVIDQDRQALTSTNMLPVPNEPLLNAHYSNQTHHRPLKGPNHLRESAFSPGNSNTRESISMTRSPTKSPSSLIEEIVSDTAYYESVDKYRKSRLLSTRSRILDRYNQHLLTGTQNDRVVTEFKTTFELTKSVDTTPTAGSNADSKEKRTEVIETDKEREKIRASVSFDEVNISDNGKKGKNIALSWKSRIIPFLNLTHSLNAHGDLQINLSNSLISESSVSFLSLKNGNCTLSAFDIMLSTYCKPWQLEFMKILNLENNPRLGSKGAELLGNALRRTCQLIHLNLNSCAIGDNGLRFIFAGIIDGQGEDELLRLDLQNNHITIATDSFTRLNEFKNLKFLDISKNLFTLDKPIQWQYFYDAIYPLIHHKLEYLSLAYNKIQDHGFQQFVDQILLTNDSIYYFLPLKILDVANCFITNKSKYHLELLIVNSLQRENDGNVYKLGFEYTEKHLYQSDIDALGFEIESRYHSQRRASNHNQNNSGGGKKSSLGKSKRNRYASFHQSVLASMKNQPIRSKFNEQKISKVFFKPEMIPIIANVRRSRHSSSNNDDTNTNTSAVAKSSSNGGNQGKQRRSSFVADTLKMLSSGVASRGSFFTLSNDSTDAGSVASVGAHERYAIPQGNRTSFMLAKGDDDATAIVLGNDPTIKTKKGSSNQVTPNKSQRKKTKNFLRDSFFNHLNQIVHHNENIILMLNSLDQPPSLEQYQEFQVTSYYILTNLQMILLQGNILTQNIWDEILDFQQKSTIKIFYHPNHHQKQASRPSSSSRRISTLSLTMKNGMNIFAEEEEEEEEEDDEEPEEKVEEEFGVYGSGIQEFDCYNLLDYNIDLHETELANL